MGDYDEKKELQLLRDQVRELMDLHLDAKQEITLLKQIRDRLPVPGKLSFIKLAFGGDMAVGPVTLTVGQKTTATVLGFDQNGAPIAIDFTANPVTWTLDNTTLDSSTPQPDQSDVVASLAAGTANLSAACAGFTDTEQVINVAQAPVLSSIKINFA
jgi:hypothetical protein